MEINKLNSVFIFPIIAKIKQGLLTSPKILTFELRNLRVDTYFMYLKHFYLDKLRLIQVHVSVEPNIQNTTYLT